MKKVALTRKLLPTLVLIGLFSSGCEQEPKQEQVQQPQAIPVKLETVNSSILVESSQYVGVLEAVQRVELAPKINGRIINIFVQEGDVVTPGQIVAELEPTQQQENVNAATANIQSQIAARNQAEAELRQRIFERDSLKAEVARAKAQVTGAMAALKASEADLKRAQSDLELAKVNHERASFLVTSGVQPTQELDNKRRDLETAKANLEALKKTRDSFAADVAATQEVLKASEENLKAASSRVDASSARVDQTVAQIRESEGRRGSIEQELIYNSIKAPIYGRIGNFNEKKKGDYLNTGETLTTITNNDELNLNINIPTEYLDRLKLGLPVEIIKSDGTKGVTGAVSYISPLVSQTSQSILTKITFKNDGSLKDDQYVKVRVIWNTKPGFLIPTTAVSSLGSQKFVFVAKQGDSTSQGSPLVAKQVPIQVGTIQGQSYQVLSGVQQGDQIAVSRILDLRDNTPIRKETEQSSLTR